MIDWSSSRARKDDTTIDFSGIEEQMSRWWKRCIADGKSANIVLEKSWCRAGLGGIVLLLLGLKEWGSRTRGKAEREKWSTTVLEIKDVFMQIPSADRL